MAEGGEGDKENPFTFGKLLGHICFALSVSLACDLSNSNLVLGAGDNQDNREILSKQN